MCKVFYYKSVNFFEKTGELVCTYGVDGDYTFTETITFPDAPHALSPKKKQALAQILPLLHIALGISYYKAFLPQKLVIEQGGLTPDEANFFNRFYLSGLGEFAIRNHLNLQDKIHFPVAPITHTPITLKLPYNAFVPVGGGKDSCVSMELLKELDLPVMAISGGNARPITESIAVSHLPFVLFQRKIDPTLLTLNAQGKVYNGHVPITGILAFILWFAAILYDKKYVVMSCERSANVGNMMQGDLAINHQYSKSFAFESDFYRLTQTITPEFRYFSLLRPLSEAHIAKLFAQKCRDYFPVFTSCNKAFKLDETKRLNRWCGSCDKCRFVFLILAPFMDKKTLIDCVGANPLNDPEQVEGYRELLGLSGHKPFECVGEFDESRWAFNQLKNHPDWQNDTVIRQLSVPDVQSDLIFTPSATHLIPQELSDVLDEFRR